MASGRVTLCVRRRLFNLGFFIMNFMYAVVIDNLPAKALHPNLRDREMEYYWLSDEPITYKKYIGPVGRFSAFKGAAYMDTEQLAERFLLHFRPIMDKRGYQDCPMSIFRFPLASGISNVLLK